MTDALQSWLQHELEVIPQPILSFESAGADGSLLYDVVCALDWCDDTAPIAGAGSGPALRRFNAVARALAAKDLVLTHVDIQRMLTEQHGATQRTLLQILAAAQGKSHVVKAVRSRTVKAGTGFTAAIDKKDMAQSFRAAAQARAQEAEKDDVLQAIRAGKPRNEVMLVSHLAKFEDVRRAAEAQAGAALTRDQALADEGVGQLRTKLQESRRLKREWLTTHLAESEQTGAAVKAQMAAQRAQDAAHEITAALRRSVRAHNQRVAHRQDALQGIASFSETLAKRSVGAGSLPGSPVPMHGTGLARKGVAVAQADAAASAAAQPSTVAPAPMSISAWRRGAAQESSSAALLAARAQGSSAVSNGYEAALRATDPVRTGTVSGLPGATAALASGPGRAGQAGDEASPTDEDDTAATADTALLRTVDKAAIARHKSEPVQGWLSRLAGTAAEHLRPEDSATEMTAIQARVRGEARAKFERETRRRLRDARIRQLHAENAASAAQADALAKYLDEAETCAAAGAAAWVQRTRKAREHRAIALKVAQQSAQQTAELDQRVALYTAGAKERRAAAKADAQQRAARAKATEQAAAAARHEEAQTLVRTVVDELAELVGEVVAALEDGGQMTSAQWQEAVQGFVTGGLTAKVAARNKAAQALAIAGQQAELGWGSMLEVDSAAVPSVHAVYLQQPSTADSLGADTLPLVPVPRGIAGADAFASVLLAGAEAGAPGLPALAVQVARAAVAHGSCSDQALLRQPVMPEAGSQLHPRESALWEYACSVAADRAEQLAQLQHAPGWAQHWARVWGLELLRTCAGPDGRLLSDTAVHYSQRLTGLQDLPSLPAPPLAVAARIPGGWCWDGHAGAVQSSAGAVLRVSSNAGPLAQQYRLAALASALVGGLPMCQGLLCALGITAVRIASTAASAAHACMTGIIDLGVAAPGGDGEAESKQAESKQAGLDARSPEQQAALAFAICQQSVCIDERGNLQLLVVAPDLLREAGQALADAVHRLVRERWAALSAAVQDIMEEVPPGYRSALEHTALSAGPAAFAAAGCTASLSVQVLSWPAEDAAPEPGASWIPACPNVSTPVPAVGLWYAGAGTRCEQGVQLSAGLLWDEWAADDALVALGVALGAQVSDSGAPSVEGGLACLHAAEGMARARRVQRMCACAPRQHWAPAPAVSAGSKSNARGAAAAGAAAAASGSAAVQLPAPAENAASGLLAATAAASDLWQLLQGATSGADSTTSMDGLQPWLRAFEVLQGSTVCSAALSAATRRLRSALPDTPLVLVGLGHEPVQRWVIEVAVKSGAAAYLWLPASLADCAVPVSQPAQPGPLPNMPADGLAAAHALLAASGELCAQLAPCYSLAAARADTLAMQPEAGEPAAHVDWAAWCGARCPWGLPCNTRGVQTPGFAAACSAVLDQGTAASSVLQAVGGKNAGKAPATNKNAQALAAQVGVSAVGARAVVISEDWPALGSSDLAPPAAVAAASSNFSEAIMLALDSVGLDAPDSVNWEAVDGADAAAVGQATAQALQQVRAAAEARSPAELQWLATSAQWVHAAGLSAGGQAGSDLVCPGPAPWQVPFGDSDALLRDATQGVAAPSAGSRKKQKATPAAPAAAASAARPTLAFARPGQLGWVISDWRLAAWLQASTAPAELSKDVLTIAGVSAKSKGKASSSKASASADAEPSAEQLAVAAAHAPAAAVRTCSCVAAAKALLQPPVAMLGAARLAMNASVAPVADASAASALLSALASPDAVAKCLLTAPEGSALVDPLVWWRAANKACDAAWVAAASAKLGLPDLEALHQARANAASWLQQWPALGAGSEDSRSPAERSVADVLAGHAASLLALPVPASAILAELTMPSTAGDQIATLCHVVQMVADAGTGQDRPEAAQVAGSREQAEPIPATFSAQLQRQLQGVPSHVARGASMLLRETLAVVPGACALARAGEVVAARARDGVARAAGAAHGRIARMGLTFAELLRSPEHVRGLVASRKSLISSTTSGASLSRPQQGSSASCALQPVPPTGTLAAAAQASGSVTARLKLEQARLGLTASQLAATAGPGAQADLLPWQTLRGQRLRPHLGVGQAPPQLVSAQLQVLQFADELAGLPAAAWQDEQQLAALRDRLQSLSALAWEAASGRRAAAQQALAAFVHDPWLLSATLANLSARAAAVAAFVAEGAARLQAVAWLDAVAGGVGDSPAPDAVQAWLQADPADVLGEAGLTRALQADAALVTLQSHGDASFVARADRAEAIIFGEVSAVQVQPGAVAQAAEQVHAAATIGIAALQQQLAASSERAPVSAAAWGCAEAVATGLRRFVSDGFEEVAHAVAESLRVLRIMHGWIAVYASADDRMVSSMVSVLSEFLVHGWKFARSREAVASHVRTALQTAERDALAPQWVLHELGLADDADLQRAAAERGAAMLRPSGPGAALVLRKAMAAAGLPDRDARLQPSGLQLQPSAEIIDVRELREMLTHASAAAPRVDLGTGPPRPDEPQWIAPMSKVLAQLWQAQSEQLLEAAALPLPSPSEATFGSSVEAGLAGVQAATDCLLVCSAPLPRPRPELSVVGVASLSRATSPASPSGAGSSAWQSHFGVNAAASALASIAVTLQSQLGHAWTNARADAAVAAGAGPAAAAMLRATSASKFEVLQDTGFAEVPWGTAAPKHLTTAGKAAAVRARRLRGMEERAQLVQAARTGTVTEGLVETALSGLRRHK